MNKTLLAAALLSSLVTSSAQAATVVGFKIGGDYWQADATGTFSDDVGQPQAFHYDSSAQGSIWVAIEHPIPILPNLMIRENRLDEKGTIADADFIFNSRQFEGDLTAYTDLSNTDFVLYYELLDNDIVALDLGASYKKMSGSIRVVDEDLYPEQKNIDSGVVMAYASAKFGLPGFGLYGFADVMTGLNETSVYDYSLGLGWEFDGTALDYRVRAGYRDFNFDVRQFSSITSDLQFKGYFAGVEIDF